jgi:acyl carrier protein
MTVSSRTPEGVPNHCPICDAVLCLEPSDPAGDAPCPCCGSLLWFVQTSSGVRFHDAEATAPIRERLIEMLAAHLGVRKEAMSRPASFIEEVGADSLDIVELVLELEEEFDITIPEDEAAEIKTVGDALDCILRRLGT